jgi:LacI family transcriptional regulator
VTAPHHGQAPPTIYDVARHAGVSIATVSRAINDLDGLRPATKARVMAAVEELGYIPDATARSLSLGAHATIGFLFISRAHEAYLKAADEDHESLLFDHDITRGAMWRAQVEGYKMMIGYVDSRSAASTARDILGRTDGLVLVDRVVDAETLAWLSHRKPVVAVAWEHPVAEETVLRIDNRGSMTELVQHLTRVHGHRQIGVITGPSSSADAVERLACVYEVARQEGAAVVEMGCGDYSETFAARLAERWLASGAELPRAVMCMNDQMATGLLATLERRGIAVPERCAVTGFDDIIISRYLRPALTTVRQPAEELGSLAVITILDALNGEQSQTRDIVLHTEVMIRQSCGCPPDHARHREEEP